MGFSYEVTDVDVLRAIKKAIFKGLINEQFEDVYFTVTYAARRVVGDKYRFEYLYNETRRIEVPISDVKSIIRSEKLSKIIPTKQPYTNEEISKVVKSGFKREITRYDNILWDDTIKFTKSKFSDSYSVPYIDSKNKQRDYRIDITKVHAIIDRDRKRLNK